MTTATYLYCLVQARKAPDLRAAPKGLPGAGAARALDAGGGLWLVAADAPLDRYGAEPIERGLRDLSWVSACAVPHEAMVEHLSRLGTVVPMKLFTLFRSDARALQHVLKQRRSIDRLLERLRGREEWGVRVSFDEIAARERAHTLAQRESKGAPGAAFLLRKKKEQDAQKEVLVRARERADQIFDALAAFADEARRRAPPAAPGVRVVLDAAVLIAHGQVKRFQQRARAEAKKLAKDGYALVLTGPWPPYNFIAESA